MKTDSFLGPSSRIFHICQRIEFFELENVEIAWYFDVYLVLRAEFFKILILDLMAKEFFQVY